MRVLVPPEKWSPFRCAPDEASDFMIESKAAFVDVMIERGIRFLRTKTPGPDKSMWYHSSCSVLMVSMSDKENLLRS